MVHLVSFNRSNKAGVDRVIDCPDLLLVLSTINPETLAISHLGKADSPRSIGAIKLQM
jgi:hypothetical protein